MNVGKKHARIEALQSLVRDNEKEIARLQGLLDAANQNSKVDADFIVSLNHFMFGMVKFERGLDGVFVMSKYEPLHMGTKTHSTGEKSPLKAVQLAKNVGWLRTQKEIEADDGI